MADFWGYKGALEANNQNKGISLVCISNDKGHELFSAVSKACIIEDVDIKFAKQCSRHLYLHPAENNKRFYILKQIDHLSFEELLKYIFCKNKKRNMVARCIKRIKSKIKKLMFNKSIK